MLWREHRGQRNPSQPHPARSLSDEYGEEQCSRGEERIRVGCDRVGVEVRGGGSSGGSDVLGGGGGCTAGGVDDSASAETLAGWAEGVKVFKGTRRSGDEAVPKTSSGPRSWHPVRGINCQPEETKRSEGTESA